MLKKVTKRNYKINARFEKPGVAVYNFLEDAHYTTTAEKCIVLTGTAGEEWVVTAAKLQKTYLLDGKEMAGNIEELLSEQQVIETKAGSEIYYAEFLPVAQKAEVATSWGEILQANRDGVPHGEGDYIVCSANEDGTPNLKDRWVVNGLVFADTYVEA